MNNISIIYRYSEPSKLDTADFGAICKVSNNFNNIFYVQISIDPENPQWEKIDSQTQEEALTKVEELIKNKK